MNLDKVLRWFMPKEERFHELLERATKNLVEGAQTFSEIAHATSLEDRQVKSVHLKAIEREGDGITRQISEALNTTFITPFDREDIRSLASDLDDILDHLESVATGGPAGHPRGGGGRDHRGWLSRRPYLYAGQRRAKLSPSDRADA